jgi:hypothetical protein
MVLGGQIVGSPVQTANSLAMFAQLVAHETPVISAACRGFWNPMCTQQNAPGQSEGATHQSSAKPAPHAPGMPQCSVCGVFRSVEKQQISPSGQTPPAHATGFVGFPPLLDALVLLAVPQPVLLELVLEPVVPEDAGTHVPFELLHDVSACAAVVAPSAYQVSSPKSLVQVPIAFPAGQLVPFVPFSDAHVIIWVATSLGERPW